MNGSNFKSSIFHNYAQNNSSAKRIKVTTLHGNLMNSYQNSNYLNFGELISLCPVYDLSSNLYITVRMNYNPAVTSDTEAKKLYKEIMSTFQQK